MWVAARLAVASAEVPKLLAEEEVRQANAPTTRQVKGIFGWINTPCSFAAVARLPSIIIIIMSLVPHSTPYRRRHWTRAL